MASVTVASAALVAIYAGRSSARRHNLVSVEGRGHRFEALSGRLLSPLVADLLTGLVQLFRGSALAETFRTVEELAGRKPRTLSAWLAENIDAFRG